MAENLLIANTAEEAVNCKTAGNVYLAGGTEIMRLNSYVDADSYVSIRKISQMRKVTPSVGSVDIGAACTFQEIIDAGSAPDYLKEALHFNASRTRRNMATIGGNIAICRDDSYLVPTLMAAGAELDLLNTNGEIERVTVEGYISGKDKYADSLITNIRLSTGGITVKSSRSANTAQSHARLTASLGFKDGEYSAYAAVKKLGIVKMGTLMKEMNSDKTLSEDEIVEIVKNDAGIALEDDLLYGGADYRKYLIGITFALLYEGINNEGGRA